MANSSAIAVITRRAADRLRAGHPWVYRSDVEEIQPATGVSDVAPGELVVVTDSRGIALGTALSSTASQIALRIVTREVLPARDAFLSLLRQRLAKAIALRRRMGLFDNPATDACRLVFSEADELPGLIIDRYAGLVILQLLTQGMDSADVRATLIEGLREELADAVDIIVERPDPRIRELEQLAAPQSAALWERWQGTPLSTIFHLNSLAFHYDAGSGQKTGAFLDQRENYAAAAARAHGEALDVCTYQGGFALHLAQWCERVTGVDVSRAALEVAERNLELNRAQLVNEGRGVEWLEADAFALMKDFSDAGRHYDTIVVDPPAFAKTRRAAEGALRGYKELNLRAFKMLNAGGTLVTCSCSHHISLEDFTGIIASAAIDAGKRVRLVETRGAAEDHPAILSIPETTYLKCLICEVE
jgi:23S rRNA (cytosine1962-C5)-methyltransferase